MDTHLLRHGIQASVELSLWLSSFSDIDLSYAGNYQIVPTVKVQSDIPSAVEVVSLQSKGDHQYLVRPAYLRNNKYPCSQIFHLTRAAQTVDLDDLFSYRVFMLLDPAYLGDALNKAEITIYLEVFYISSSSTDTADAASTIDSPGEERPSVSSSSTAAIRRDLSVTTTGTASNTSTSSSKDNGRRRICLRTLKVRLGVGGGSVCAYRPVIFGSGCNLCSAEVGIFAALIALSEPYQRFHKTVVRKEGWRQKQIKDYVVVEGTANFEAILSAGTTEHAPADAVTSTVSNNSTVVFTARTLHTGIHMLKTMCLTLLTAYEALQSYYFELDSVVNEERQQSERLFPGANLTARPSSTGPVSGNRPNNNADASPSPSPSQSIVRKDCVAVFETIERELNDLTSNTIATFKGNMAAGSSSADRPVIAECFERLCEYGQMTVSRLSAETCQLWERHQHSYLGNYPVARYLRKRFRAQQLSRLEEGVFLLDHPITSLLEPSESARILQRHDAVWSLMKQSPYYTMLPTLPIECVECDGKASEVPAVFADRYICVPTLAAHAGAHHNGESMPDRRHSTHSDSDGPRRKITLAQRINTLTQPGAAAALEHQVGMTTVLVSEGAKAVAGVLNERFSRVRKLVATNIEKHRNAARTPSAGSTSSSNASSAIGADAAVESSPRKATVHANGNGQAPPPQSQQHGGDYMTQECSFWEMLREKPPTPSSRARDRLADSMQKPNSGASVNDAVDAANGKPDDQTRTLAARSPASARVVFDKARKDFCRLYVTQFNGLLWCDHPMRSHEALSAQLNLPVRGAAGVKSVGGVAGGGAKPRAFSLNSSHLIVCVHGLEGSGEDMKLVKTYLEQALPNGRMEFLICDSVEGDMTYESIETLSCEIVSEIVMYITRMTLPPDRISFIGHSMGTVLIRAAIANDIFEPYRAKLYTFLSLSGPHLGLMSNPSRLVYAGLLLLQNWKRSRSLAQLAMKDHPDLRKTFLYTLSQKDKLAHFHNILLAASGQDFYAPYHSARIEMTDTAGLNVANARAASTVVSAAVDATDDIALSPSMTSVVSNAPAYIINEMVRNIMQPIVDSSERAAQLMMASSSDDHNDDDQRSSIAAGALRGAVNVIRYDVRCDQRGNRVDAITGRLNHIAFIDSEVFLEKFLAVHAFEYFI